MNMNYLGPLGSVVSMGFSRLVNENTALKAQQGRKMKKVNDQSSAFNPPLPLRTGGDKSSKSPLKPNPIMPNLRGRQNPVMDYKVLEEIRRQKNRRKKKQDEETQTPTQTTSTTTTSTTTSPVTTTSSATIASTTPKQKMAQFKVRDEVAKLNSNNNVVPPVANIANSTNNTSSTTSSYTTTTMGKQNNREKTSKFSSPLDVTTAFKGSSYNDFNKPGQPEAVFDTPSQNEAVKYSTSLPGTLHLNVNEVSDYTIPDFNGRFFLNISSFADAIWNANGGTGTNKEYNPGYFGHITDIFWRMNKDVVSNARTTVSSAWGLDNFCKAMRDTAFALELIFTFDSVTAYNPQLKDVYNRNDACEEYQKLIYTTDLLTARYNLARRLKSMWFPPEFAQMIRWFYQTYRVSTLSQAAYYRFVPHGNFILSNPGTTTTGNGSQAELLNLFNTATTNLTNSNTQTIASILARLYPQGIIRNIPYSCNDAVYDDTHFEIYSNEPVFWKTPVDTVEANWSVFPIVYGSTGSPGSTNNEIPYYMSHNPTNDDGFAFVMQNIVSVTSSSGYEIVNNSTTAFNMYIEGIRSFTPDRIAAATLTLSTQNIKNSNKWVFDHTASKFYPRCGNIPNALSGNDATSVIAYTTTTTSTWSINPISRPNTAHQRCYFNNRKAPELNRRLLIDKLFSIAG